MIALRNEILGEAEHGHPVRIGAAGGIGTPISILGAFVMGADYVVTGSVNQACLEAGTSARVKTYLAEADFTDVIMAPSADMFEMGVNVQVLKRGSLFPMRAQKLYSVYREYDALEEIPDDIRTDLEEKIFQESLNNVWLECIRFFTDRDPDQLERARQNPKKKMALVFRWYLGLATYWGIQGDTDRSLDYQVWCGPAMGAFNNWYRGSDFEDPSNRSAVKIADRLMTQAARLFRFRSLQTQGYNFPQDWFQDQKE
jgi:PfaD family protein